MPAGMLPRNATKGFDGRANDTRTAPFPNTVRSGRFRSSPPARGTGPRTGGPGSDNSSRPRAPVPAGPSRPLPGMAHDLVAGTQKFETTYRASDTALGEFLIGPRNGT